MHYPLASPIHGGGGPRKRWKGLACGDNESYSSCTIPAAPPLVAGATTLPGGKRVTGFSVALRLPTNPVPLPPPVQGHYGRWAFRSICAWSSSERKTIQPGFARGKCTPSAACGTKGGKSHRRWLLSADWYLLPFVSNAACTEILRWCGDPA